MNTYLVELDEEEMRLVRSRMADFSDPDKFLSRRNDEGLRRHVQWKLHTAPKKVHHPVA